MNSWAEKPIENFVEVSKRIYSGAQPKGEDSFVYLKQQRIKTIISVDGQVPNIGLAKKYGLNYVHIPVGYDGIPIEAQKALLNVLRTKQAPYFIHCHHGKHRGPTATAILSILDGSTKGESIKILKTAGTNPEYKGLWKSVEEFKPSLKEPLPELQEISPTSPLVSAMIMVDSAHDKLKKSRTKEELIYLKEGFLETERTLTSENDELYRKYLNQSLKITNRLLDVFPKNEKLLRELSNLCKKCHKAYRD